jgi:hypothetical protein
METYRDEVSELRKIAQKQVNKFQGQLGIFFFFENSTLIDFLVHPATIRSTIVYEIHSRLSAEQILTRFFDFLCQKHTSNIQ